MLTVAAVSYPLFCEVPETAFLAYHARHCRRMQWLVGPSFAAEIVSGAWCVCSRPCALGLLALGMTLLGLALTGAVAVPLHATLGRGRNEQAIMRLVCVHLIRCCMWTANLMFVALTLYSRR